MDTIVTSSKLHYQTLVSMLVSTEGDKLELNWSLDYLHHVKLFTGTFMKIDNKTTIYFMWTTFCKIHQEIF